MTLKITQAAREAAAECCPKGLYELCGCYGSGVSGYSGFPCSDCGGSGGLPPDWLTQAFQRAMNQAADEALERAEARMNDFAREARKVAHDGPSRSPESCYEYAAKGIRALKGQQP